MKPLLILACALAAATFASAQAPADVTIDGLNLGTYWSGAEVTKNDLVGKVVLVEIWGS